MNLRDSQLSKTSGILESLIAYSPALKPVSRPRL